MVSKEKYKKLHDSFKRLMNDYGNVYENVKNNGDWKNPFRDVVYKDIPEILKECSGISEPYKIVGSYGKGRWTAVPWISVFDKRITESAQQGVYIVYLLNKDTKELYLTLNQGATNVVRGPNETGKSRFTGVTGSSSEKNLNELRQNATLIRASLNTGDFDYEPEIKTGALNYDAGSILYRKYTLDTLPSGEKIIDDLQEMIKIYAQYQLMLGESVIDDDWYPSLEKYQPGFSKENWLEILNNPDVFKPVWGSCLAMFYTEKEGTTCAYLGTKFNYNSQSIRTYCLQLAKKIYSVTNCKLHVDENGNQEYWPILFQGKHESFDGRGSYTWRLRAELYDALTEFNILRFLPREGGEEEMQISTKDAVNKIKSYIASKGFSYADGLIENFYLSLKSKPFVILAGTSGTGKTRLVKLFAEAIGANYKMVAVRPDWSDSSDLFGHVDLNGRFIPGEILEFIYNAYSDLEKPYVLCLDEMNLARVEYYLSDFLSIIETRDVRGDSIVSDPLITSEKYGSDDKSRELYGEIGFPENLYLVGTVNMDETTFPFSKKVLDRANTIEFNNVDLIPQEIEYEDVKPLVLPNSFLKTEYLLLAQCMHEKEFVMDISTELQRLNEILQKANAHVGYRVRDEIVFYMLNNKKSELLSRDEAFDNEIMQKILPRIQGSSSSVKEMLCELFKEFVGDYEGYQTQNNDAAFDMLKKLNRDGGRYPKSAEKVAFMVRRFEEDGFTSYWL